MPDSPHRSRFQIHLSTAIVLMFVAGGLIWANVSGRRVDGSGNEWYPTGPPMPGDAMTESEFFASSARYWWGNRLVEYGWPVDAMQSRSEILIRRNGVMQIPPKPLPTV